MSEIAIALLIAKTILINTKNLIKAVEKAKSDDGKVTVEELPEIMMDTAIKSLDDLGVGNLGE